MKKQDKGINLHKAFPKKIQKLVSGLVQYENYNEEYLLVSMLSAVSSAAGNAVKIRIKGEWVTSSAIYAILVGDAGIGKSQPLDFAYLPIRAVDKKYRDEYEALLKQLENTKRRNGAVVPPRIQLKRNILSDFTPEALMSAHATNLRGITALIDEIMGMFNSINQYSKGQLVEQLLTAYSGKPLDVTRVSMELPLHIEHPCINIIGTTQTDRLKEIFRNGYEENGFLDRFLFSYPLNSIIPLWNKENAKQPTKCYFEEWDEIMSHIIEIPFEAEYNDCKVLTLTEEATDCLYDWHNANVMLIQGAEVDSRTRSRMMKTIQNVPRLALIVQLMRWACGEAGMKMVEQCSLKSAIQISEYFEDSYSRIGEVISMYQLRWSGRKLFEALPDEFTTKMAVTKGYELGMGKRNVMYTITHMIDSRMVEKVKHGKYRKKRKNIER